MTTDAKGYWSTTYAGTVLDDEGNPVEGAEVTLERNRISGYSIGVLAHKAMRRKQLLDRYGELAEAQRIIIENAKATLAARKEQSVHYRKFNPDLKKYTPI